MHLTEREKANVLLALRILQGMPKDAFEDAMPLDGHDIMDADEVDDLIDELNLTEGEE